MMININMNPFEDFVVQGQGLILVHEDHEDKDFFDMIKHDDGHQHEPT